jgi:AcrR family transcriptional regulator
MAMPPVSGERPLRADARRNRERILQAAREIVAEAGTTAQIDDVARKAGVGVGTVYRHFPTKDALMGELIVQCVLENIEVVERHRGSDEPGEAFAGMVREACELMAADAARRRMWQAATEEAFEYARPAKRQLEEACERLIRDARDTGDLRPDFTVADMPTLMSALAAAVEASVTGGPAAPDWRRMLEIVLDGLRAQA